MTDTDRSPDADPVAEAEEIVAAEARANSLALFLSQDPNTAIQAEVYIPRIDTKMVVEAMRDTKLYDQMHDRCATWTKRNGIRVKVDVNERRLARLMIAQWTSWPPFRRGHGAEADEAFDQMAAHYGTDEPEILVGRVLLPGEIRKVANAIMEVSGFEDENDDDNGEGGPGNS